MPVARVLSEEGCDWLGVATVDEARELRDGGILLPILLLGMVLPDEVVHLFRYGVSAVVADKEYLSMIGESSQHSHQALGIHLKVELGMGRLGCKPEEALDLLKYSTKYKNLRWEGVMTHYPCSDNGQTEPTAGQQGKFIKLVSEIRASGFPIPLAHSANSGAILGHPKTHMDMVRPGILLYGYAPTRDLPGGERFLPVMEMESRVMFLKTLEEPMHLSYGSTYLAQKGSRIATIGAGYGDGYTRALSNKAMVRIQGQLYKVSGRVCMDQFLVDLGTSSEVGRWEKVGLFGPYSEGPNAWDLAEILGTIPYEVTCSVSRRVQRIYTDETLK